MEGYNNYFEKAKHIRGPFIGFVDVILDDANVKSDLKDKVKDNIRSALIDSLDIIVEDNPDIFVLVDSSNTFCLLMMFLFKKITSESDSDVSIDVLETLEGDILKIFMSIKDGGNNALDLFKKHVGYSSKGGGIC